MLPLTTPCLRLTSLIRTTRSQPGTIIPLFLCPSDKGQSVSSGYGVSALAPTNYVANMGTGLKVTPAGNRHGSPYDADGVFYADSRTRIADITDGTSNTAAMSESTLGEGAESASGPTPPADRRKVYAWLSVTDSMSDAACASPHTLESATTQRLRLVLG
jgi:hypothetical protein